MVSCVEAIREEGTIPSLFYSLMLHALVLLLAVFIYAHKRPELPTTHTPVIVADLVPLSEFTTSPDAAEKATVPQQRAPEQTGRPDATAVPVPNNRRTAMAQEHAELPHAKSSAATRSGESDVKRTPSIGENGNAAGGDLNARLEAFAHLSEPPSQLVPDPRPQEGQGTSNTTVADRSSRRGNTASYGVKDFVRAQIERHWYVDRASKEYTTARSQHWTVLIHLTLNSDGTVASADIANPAAELENATFLTFALSVRNATLLSSPLEMLPGSYDLVKDLVLDFTTNDIAQ